MIHIPSLFLNRSFLLQNKHEFRNYYHTRSISLYNLTGLNCFPPSPVRALDYISTSMVKRTYPSTTLTFDMIQSVIHTIHTHHTPLTLTQTDRIYPIYCYRRLQYRALSIDNKFGFFRYRRCVEKVFSFP